MIVGPMEREAYDVNRKFLERFPIVAEANGCELRRIRGRSDAQR